MVRSNSAAAALLVVTGLHVPAVASEPPCAYDAPTPPVTNGAVATIPDRSGVKPPDALYAITTRIDRIGRIVVPVMVNRRGPFQFILDTGANTTVLTPHLAEVLGLKIDSTRMVIMNGVTGSAPVPTASVDRVEAGAVLLEDRHFAIANASVVGTDGVLGVDGLKDKVVLVDFIHDRVEVLDARTHRPRSRLARIPGKMRLGRLLVVDALVGTHKVKAVIDTGGQHTLGNLALYEALGLHPTTAARDAAAEVIGATDARQQGQRQVVRVVTMGDLRTINLTVTFGDFYIFKLWDLQSTPAIVIGMDMLGTLDTFGVDYLRDEVQIRARM